MTDIEFIKNTIADEFPNLELVEQCLDEYAVKIRINTGVNMPYSQCDSVLYITKEKITFYEILQLCPVGDDQIITSIPTRELDRKEVTNLMLYFSMRNIYSNYTLLMLKYKQWKEELKLDEIDKDFK